jgi:NAD(P)-dependent dehydrogenase (short-subunit alcohol dehydrogenase family)
MSELSLQGKHALVTGGTRGIGLEIARGFAQAGAKVTVCSRRPENVEAALVQLHQLSDSVQGVAAHVGKSDDIQRLVTTAQEKFGVVNVLVNNAGTNPFFGPIVDADETAWDKTMQVNLKGPFLLAKACAPAMAESGGGSIVNISSIAGLTASPMQGIYSVSKAGLIMLTKVLARELGSQKIRVNAICPGLIKTQLSQALWSNPSRVDSIVKMKALGRMGEARELVGAALYFASEASSFTTGAVLQVDGGMVI